MDYDPCGDPYVSENCPQYWYKPLRKPTSANIRSTAKAMPATDVARRRGLWVKFLHTMGTLGIGCDAKRVLPDQPF